LNKLNKKLIIIEKKLNKILKNSLKTQLYELIGINQSDKFKQKNDEKKRILSEIISKYLKGTENFDEEEEKNLINESILFNSDIQNSVKNGEKFDETWVNLSIIKNKDKNIKEKLKIIEDDKFNISD
jgi:hypothetical protein